MAMYGECSICKDEGAVEPIWKTCESCYSTGRILSREQDISMSRALILLGEAVQEGAKQARKVTKPEKTPTSFKASEDHLVNIKNFIDPNIKVTKHVSEELYRELEYEVSVEGALDTPSFGRARAFEAVEYYRQLLDIALLGGDIKWARQLNNQIKRAKGIAQ